MTRKAFKLVLDSVRELTPGVRHFAFTRDDGGQLDFTPGQFVQFNFDDGEPFRRSYSIASIPGQDRTVDIAVSAVADGRATRRFWSMEPGEPVETMGPFGRLVLRDEPVERYVLVSTGTGVTPYRSMLPTLTRKLAEQGGEVHILFGTRSREDLLYAEDFVAAMESVPGLRYTAHYSRVMPGNPASWERQGYVQEAFEGMDLDPESDMVFLCGNPNMIDEAFARLTGQGFGSQRVRREKYISGA